MGSNVDFIAFRERPDESMLAALNGLGAFRLFKREGRDEWYLEGQGTPTDEITFFEPLNYSGRGQAWGAAQDTAQRFHDDMQSLDLRPTGIDRHRIAEAILISQELNCSLLLVYGNDDGVDLGMVCSSGQIEQARLATHWEGRQIILDADGLSLRLTQPGEPVASQSGSDEGSDVVLDLHQFGTEMANIFFGDSQRWWVTSDPTEFKVSDYRLIQSAGDPPEAGQAWQPVQPKVDPLLYELLATMPPGRQRLRQVLRALDVILAPVLEERAMSAERAEVETWLSRCGAALIVLRDIPGHPPVAKQLMETAGLAQGYLRMLRPRLEYRRRDEIKMARQQLSAHWARLKLALVFAKL